MNKKLRIITLVILVIVCCFMFGSCEFKYGSPDQLGVGNATFGQRISIGLQVAALGVGFVFAVLVILILMINAIKYLFVLMDKIKANLANKKQPQTQPQTPVVIETPTQDNDEEIMAAITAALMAYYDAEQKIVYESNVKFKVRSIKEI